VIVSIEVRPIQGERQLALMRPRRRAFAAAATRRDGTKRDCNGGGGDIRQTIVRPGSLTSESTFHYCSNDRRFLIALAAYLRLRSRQFAAMIRGRIWGQLFDRRPRSVGREPDVPRKAKGLTAAKVDKETKPGRYGDGAGLYLLVRSGTSKFWLFRYTRAGKTREMGLGAAKGRSAVSLADARDNVAELRRQLREGRDPFDEREAEKARRKASATRAVADGMTFGDVADRYIAAHEAGWRNPKHRQQWRNTLKSYVRPTIGGLAVGAVGVGEVMRILEPLWQAKPETASRVRGRLERILDHAKARGWREGENPARWRGHLDQLLPARAKLRAVNHHAALPYAEAGGFIAELRQQGGTAARALEFTILTATRSGEALKARWSEINLAQKTWTIPASRMKGTKEHRVPLPGPAVAILKEQARLQPSKIAADDPSAFVFPGARRKRPLSDMAMLKLLERMGHHDITVHGFRSTFRDWAAERTNFPNHVVEVALAHAISDKVEAAYRRGDLFEKRRRLMDAWATFCAQPSRATTHEAKVTRLRG
jgi:integrase